MKFETLDDSLRAAYGVADCDMKKSIVEKRLAFGTTTVHFFANILGDNPATLNGPPLTIGWEPSDTTTVDVDTFERHRPEQQRRRLPPLERQKRLEAEGYTTRQIMVAIRGVNRAKVKRRKSRSDGIREKEKEIIDNFCRMGRRLLRRPWGKLRNIDEEDELWTQANASHATSSSKRLPNTPRQSLKVLVARAA